MGFLDLVKLIYYLGVTICPGLPGTVPIYTCFLDRIINSTLFSVSKMS